MKGRIFLGLFALPFFGVGIWMGYSLATTLIEAREMRSWVASSAEVVRGGYETHTGDDSSTYEAFGEYTYQYQGQRFSNDRVSISGGGDNIGDFQTDLGNRLAAAAASREPIIVYVNPDEPQQAVVDRSIRLGLMGFKLIFMLVFGGVGLGLLIFVFVAKNEKDASAPQFRDKPWLANDDWQTAEILSSSKATMYFTWGFAALWNLISLPLPFAIYPEIVEKENYVAVIGLLFPLVGIWLISWAVRRTLEWRRFGPAPVALDPFPGSIGGHVGGTIDVRLPYDPAARFTVTLTNLYSHYSGSGKNRKRDESAKWQDTQIANASSGVRGTRLAFRFDIPENLSESDATKEEDSYYLWRLNLHGDVEGVDIDRDYEIPVYATGENSHALSEIAVREARSEQSQVDDAAVRDMTRFESGMTGRSVLFPMGRNVSSGLIGLFCGALFGGAGLFIIKQEGAIFFGGIFAAVGLLILLSSAYFMLNSLEVMRDGNLLVSVRRLLAFPIKRRELRIDAFERFVKSSSKQSRAGSKTTMYYTVHAVGAAGERLVVGEGYKGASQAEAGIRMIADTFGLKVRKTTEHPQAEDGDYDFLAADS